jgi:hypothetical protein
MSSIASTPDQIRLAALINEVDHQKEFLSNQLHFSRKLADIHRQRAREIADVLGEHTKNYENERLALRRKLAAIERDYTNISQWQQLRRQALQEGHDAINKIGFDRSKIKDIKKKYADQVQSEFQQAKLGSQQVLMAADNRVFSAGTREGLVRVGPPYPDGYFLFWNAKSPPPESEEIKEFSNAGVDPVKGRVWAHAYNDIYGDSFEIYDVYSETWAEVRFPFRMPDFTGRVSVLIDMEAPADSIVENFYRHVRKEIGGLTDDENSLVYHIGEIYLRIVGTNDIAAEPLYHYHVWFEDEQEILHTIATAGKRIRHILRSRDYYSPNQELFLGVGVRNMDHFHGDDMIGLSYFGSEWLVQSVEVVGVPALP